MNDTKNEWFGSTLETEGTPMVNDGTGRPLVLRTFEFAIKPGLTQLPTRQQIFNAHWAYMRDMIRFDGLTASTDVDPRVIIGKKRYRIFILCEPRIHHGIRVVPGKPKSLQDIFDPRLDKS